MGKVGKVPLKVLKSLFYKRADIIRNYKEAFDNGLYLVQIKGSMITHIDYTHI